MVLSIDWTQGGWLFVEIGRSIGETITNSRPNRFARYADHVAVGWFDLVLRVFVLESN